MKRKLVLTGILSCLALTIACSNDTSQVEAKSKKPYEFYIHEDSDGCQYLIVYAEKWVSQGQGVGVGITPKVNQPTKCTE